MNPTNESKEKKKKKKVMQPDSEGDEKIIDTLEKTKKKLKMKKNDISARVLKTKLATRKGKKKKIAALGCGELVEKENDAAILASDTVTDGKLPKKKKKKVKENSGPDEENTELLNCDKAAETIKCISDVPTKTGKKKKSGTLGCEQVESQTGAVILAGENVTGGGLTNKKKKVKSSSEPDVENTELLSCDKAAETVDCVSDVLEPSSKGKKKKKKCSKPNTENSQLFCNNQLTEDVNDATDLPEPAKREKKKKKIRKPDVVGAVNCVNDVLEPAKKQKKKNISDVVGDAESSSNQTTTACLSEPMKEKKKKKINISDVVGDAEASSNQTTAGLSEPMKKKKKKRMKTVSILTTDSIEKISDDTTMADVTSAVVVPTEKKKLKKDTSHYENPEAFTDGHKQSDQLNDEADLVSAKIRKKRKRKASCLVDDTECDQGALEDTKPEGETTDRDPNGNVSKDIDSASKGSDLKKKKKRTSNEQNNNSGQDEALNEGSQSKENKKKSKKKKNTGVLDRDQQKTTEDDQVNEEEADIPKKKKKRKGETNGISSKPARLKKSKHETEATCEREESMKDVVLVSVKEGNSFEINIDQGTKFGQWDTASFQSSAQQAKFFRLMGGFKKGNQAALASSPSHEKANMALGKTEEKVLERNLESEFEKALSWKKNRGIGLGFQPAQKKASYIDKHVTKSIKFED